MNGKNSFDMEFGTFIGCSGLASDIKNIVNTLKNNFASVFVCGEKGSGRKTFARFLHKSSCGTENGFYFLNFCDYSLPSIHSIFEEIKNDAESAVKTVYVADVELLSQDLQFAFIDFMNECRKNQCKIRFVFSSSCSVEEKVDETSFSKELYYLMSTVCVNILPLRNRQEDIPLLADYFFEYYKKEFGQNLSGFTDKAKEDMKSYFWAGNVAELKNAVERAFLLCKDSFVTTSDLGLVQAGNNFDVVTQDKSLKTAIDAFKRSYITKILEENSWNQTKTAKVLGIQRTYVVKLINELDIRKK